MMLHNAEIQYLTIMREVLNYGINTDDRTGTGRRRLFGRDIRVDLSDGTLPVITTRKINHHHGIEELLWMIKGSHSLKDLPDNTKPIWSSWAVKEKDIDAFIDKHIDDSLVFKDATEEQIKLQKDAKQILKKDLMQFQDSIGPMYGYFWRHSPTPMSPEVSPFMMSEHLDVKDIPSDKYQRLFEEWEERRFMHQVQNTTDPEAKGELISLQDYVTQAYLSDYDQLGEIVRLIKRQPYSARHCMSVWMPQYLPLEKTLTPQENVIAGRGALAPCHVFVQFFVDRATDGGPDHLSLRIIQRSCDLALGVCTNLVFYATLLHLMAHVCDLRVAELIWSGGDVHLYANHLETAATQVDRIPFDPPKIRINPEAKDLFKITSADIEVIDYEHQGVLKYPVSV